MLVLSRKLNESIMIGDAVEVIVLEVREGHVKLGIKAPRDISIHRQEVYEEIRRENALAVQPSARNLNSAGQALKQRLRTPPSPHRDALPTAGQPADEIP